MKRIELSSMDYGRSVESHEALQMHSAKEEGDRLVRAEWDQFRFPRQVARKADQGIH